MIVERDFPAADEVLDDVMAFVEEELDKADCPMKISMQITVAVEEIFVNIAHYAYPDGQGGMKLAVSNDDGIVTLCFTDSGIPFDPLAKADPDITLSAEERGIGGLGIYMVKKSMDEVRYERRDGQNIFAISKKIG